MCVREARAGAPPNSSVRAHTLERALAYRAHALGALVRAGADELEQAWRRWLNAGLGGRAASEAIGRTAALQLDAAVDAAHRCVHRTEWGPECVHVCEAAVCAALSAVCDDAYRTCHAQLDLALSLIHI